MSMGDVNGDQVVDIAVASHDSGHTLVTIYSGWGQAAGTASGFAPKVLATMVDPLGPNAGPLDVALGDFNADGVSELAISSASGGPQAGSKVGLWSFRVLGDSPINATVAPSPESPPSTPPGFAGPSGLTIAASDLNGDGLYELLVGQAGPGGRRAAVSAFDLGAGGSAWTLVESFSNAPVSMRQGVGLDAGDITGDGVADVAVVSEANGTAAVFDGALGRWTWTTSPFHGRPGSTRVAIVSSEGQSGSLVVTGQGARRASLAAITPYATGRPVMFQPVASPGAGALVPLGGGYVYQRSTVADPSSAFPTSPGPITPTVLFASTQGTGLVVQGFNAWSQPSVPDTYSSQLGGQAGAAFWPLQPHADPAATGPSGLTATEKVPTNLVVYPKMAYHSPYSIDLSKAPKSIYDGLPAFSMITSPTQSPWGPGKEPGRPPAVPDGAGNDWLQQRVLAVAAGAIGVDYQHHHDPEWLPTQGGPWNVASTVAYQSQGVDCTNFTAWVYSRALGVTINSATGEQAKISPTDPNGTIIPKELDDRVQIQTINHWTGYDDLASQLRPGDILIIDGDPNDPSKPTHGIMWLGSYGKDANGRDRNLIIDATGITPPHVDSSGRVVPEGVHVRPFGPPGSLNDWYYTHVDHVLRLIKDDSTALVPIAGSELPNPDRERPEPLGQDKVVDALLTIRMRPSSAGQPSLEALAMEPLDRRVYLTRDQFTSLYGADPSDMSKVKDWAAQHGLAVVQADPSTRLVRVEGKVSDVQNAFGVRPEAGTAATGDSWSYEGEISVPSDLHDIILGVMPVQPLTKADPDGSSPAPGAADAVDFATQKGYTPPELARTFGYPEGTGKGQTVGVIELTGQLDAQARGDFETYFKGLGLRTPRIIARGEGSPSSHDEMYLDIETIGGIAPDATIVANFGNDTPGDFYETVMGAIHDTGHPLDVLSISDAFPEAFLSPMYLDLASEAFLEAAVMGVSVFTSAGDYGSSRDIPDGLAHVEFPSSSPWVTSTGGVSLANGSPIRDQTVWNNYRVVDGFLSGGKGATGGGASDHFAEPQYQIDAGLVTRSVNPGHRVGRGGPDVAMIADPSTGIRLLVHGRYLTDGGTSAAAPAWAALAARLNENLGQNVGFLNPLLYGPLQKRVTYDVTRGDNTSSHIDRDGEEIPTDLGYSAADGWDMATGWGTPDGQSLLSEIRKLLRPKGR
jgi:kumamolisin